MATVQFTSNLKRFYPELAKTKVTALTVANLLDEIEQQFPGLRNYIVDDQHRLRHHVNIFINNSMIKDRDSLSDPIAETDSVYIMQALSGG